MAVNLCVGSRVIVKESRSGDRNTTIGSGLGGKSREVRQNLGFVELCLGCYVSVELGRGDGKN